MSSVGNCLDRYWIEFVTYFAASLMSAIAIRILFRRNMITSSMMKRRTDKIEPRMSQVFRLPV